MTAVVIQADMTATIPQRESRATTYEFSSQLTYSNHEANWLSAFKFPQDTKQHR